MSWNTQYAIRIPPHGCDAQCAYAIRNTHPTPHHRSPIRNANTQYAIRIPPHVPHTHYIIRNPPHNIHCPTTHTQYTIHNAQSDPYSCRIYIRCTFCTQTRNTQCKLYITALPFWDPESTMSSHVADLCPGGEGPGGSLSNGRSAGLRWKASDPDVFFWLVLILFCVCMQLRI